MTNKLLCTDNYVVDTYLEMIFKIALLRTKNKSDAEDICQEVFLRYVKNNKEFANDDHLKAWLIKVTINCSKSFFTSPWKKKILPLNEEMPYMNKEENEIYHSVLKLSLKYRTVIHLFYYEDYSIEEISKILKEKPSTIRTQLTRARRLLKEILKGDYNDI